MTYAPPPVSWPLSSLVGAALVGFQLIGEPLVGQISTRAVHAELGAVGLSVLGDTGRTEWAEAYGRRRARLVLIDERLAVAA